MGSQRVAKSAATLLCCICVIGCSTTDQAPPGVDVQIVEVIKEVQRPCAATIPVRPEPLGVLPSDAVAALAITGAKLVEYAGKGKYADRATAALRTCTKP